MLIAHRSRIFWGALLLIGLLFYTNPTWAGPVEPTPVTLRQADDASFTAQPFGDEWYNGYEHDGFTILLDAESGNWVYAVENDDGELMPSASRVMQDAVPIGTPLHLRNANTPTPAGALAKAPSIWPGVSGSQPVLVILVDFTPSETLGTTAAQWNNAFFNSTGGKSVKAFYEEASYGAFTVDPVVETQGTANDGIIEVTLGTAHPNTGGATGDPNRYLVIDAINAANPFIDYSVLDLNSDGDLDVNEVHLFVIPRGFETAFGGTGGSCSPRVWGHRWSLNSGGGPIAPTVDGVRVGRFAGGGGYMQFGEWHEQIGSGCTGTTGNMATIGIMAHELGHDIAWPDLYDTDFSSEGVGRWSVMAGGSWARAAGEPSGTTPVLPSAWEKWYQQWLTPIEVTTNTAGVNIPNAAQNNTVYQVLPNAAGVDWHFGVSSGVGEFFLIENRQQVGFDAGLYRIDPTAAGCIIWHIDEAVTSSNSNNNDETHKHVDVEEANGVQDMDAGTNRGDIGDPWPGSTGNTTFDDTSVPNNKLYSGASTGFSITNISTAGNGCTVDFEFSPTAVSVESMDASEVNGSVWPMVVAAFVLMSGWVVVRRSRG